MIVGASVGVFGYICARPMRHPGISSRIPRTVLGSGAGRCSGFAAATSCSLAGAGTPACGCLRRRKSWIMGRRDECRVGRSGPAGADFGGTALRPGSGPDADRWRRFDALRLFGQARSPEAPPDPDESEKDEAGRLDWGRIRGDALDALGKSKDLRLLAYLGTALLRTDGLPAVRPGARRPRRSGSRTYWAQVYPLIDEDAIARRNALNCFADPMAVVDRVWRLPLVASRQHGRFSLRDIDIATGQVTPGRERAEAGRSGDRRGVQRDAARGADARSRQSVAARDGRAEQHRRQDARARADPKSRRTSTRCRRSSPS